MYLVPPGASDAVAGEADIVRAQGMDFMQLPMRWEPPTDADFDAFAAAMKRLRDGKVLVHCQINLRASTMTFLYRAITLREPVDKAYDNVTAVWSPNAGVEAVHHCAARASRHRVRPVLNGTGPISSVQERGQPL